MTIWSKIKSYFAPKKTPTPSTTTISPTQRAREFYQAVERKETIKPGEIALVTPTGVKVYSGGGGGSIGTLVRTEPLITNGETTAVSTTTSISETSMPTQEYPEIYPEQKTSFLYSGIERKTKGGQLLVLKSGEAERYGITSPHWKIQSKDFYSALEEGGFAAGVSQAYSPFPSLKTRGAYEYNWANIIAGQEAFSLFQTTKQQFQLAPESFVGKPGVEITGTSKDYPMFKPGQVIGGEGTTYTLTEKYFEPFLTDIYSGARGKAKQMFYELPKSEQTKLTGGGLLTGAWKGIFGIGEITANIQMLLGTRDISKPSKQLYFGGKLGDILGMPETKSSVSFFTAPKQYLKETITSPELIGKGAVILPLIYVGYRGGREDIAKYGWKAGIKESLIKLAPLRVTSGIYAPAVSEMTKFDVRSGIIRTDDKLVRAMVGRGIETPAIVKSEQVFKILEGGTQAGVMRTKIITPYFSYYGGELGTGIRVSEVVGFGKGYGTLGLAGKDVGFGIKTLGEFGVFTSESLTKPSYDIFLREDLTKGFGTKYFGTTFRLGKTGGATADISDIATAFAGGKRLPIYSYERFDTGFLYKPSGKYNIAKTITGYEVDLTKFFRSGGAGAISTGGISKTIQQQTLKQSLSTLSSTIQTPKITGMETTKIIFPVISTKQITKQFQMPQLKLETTTKQMQKQLQMPVTISIPALQTKQSQKLFSGLKQENVLRNMQKQMTSQISALNLKQALKTQQTFKYPSITQQFRGFNIPSIWTSPRGFGFPFYFPPLGFYEGREKRKKPSRKYKYQPSLAALGLGLKAVKIPRGYETGLVTRTIVSRKSKKRKKR